MAGPIIRTYKAGSIVYFEKDKADDIFVLQNGRIILTYLSADGKTEIKEDVKLGEFFGVKSSLGRYPREETAQVLGGATVLVFKMADFELFVAQKTHLILKMMKVFSSQLRQIHHKVREQLGQFGDMKSAAFELMNVAEVFHRNGNYDHAIYAYERYLAHYQTGAYVGRAKELLALAKRSSMFPVNMPELSYEMEKKHAAGGYAPVPESGPTKALKELQTKADEHFKNGKYAEAAAIYKNLSDTKDSKSPDDDKIIELALHSLGLSQEWLGKLDEAYATLSGYVKKYGKGSKVKESILHLGMISEKKGEKEKAVMLYNKILGLPPEDSVTADARNKIAALKG